MFRRIALVSAIALSSLAFGSTARADESVTIPFTADVAFECEFSNVTPGILGYDEFPTTVLSSTLGDGVSGMVDLLCNGNAELQKKVGPSGSTTLPSSVSYDIATNLDSVDAGELTKIIVDLEVDNGEIFEADEYSFYVMLTAIPE